MSQINMLTVEKDRKLPESYLRTIAYIASQYKEIDKVILFGSWALGNAKHGSDIDLALSGDDIDVNVVTAFFAQLDEETDIPHFFDVVHFERIENSDLVNHIKNHGLVVYSRKTG